MKVLHRHNQARQASLPTTKVFYKRTTRPRSQAQAHANILHGGDQDGGIGTPGRLGTCWNSLTCESESFLVWSRQDRCICMYVCGELGLAPKTARFACVFDEAFAKCLESCYSAATRLAVEHSTSTFNLACSELVETTSTVSTAG